MPIVRATKTERLAEMRVFIDDICLGSPGVRIRFQKGSSSITGTVVSYDGNGLTTLKDVFWTTEVEQDLKDWQLLFLGAEKV